MGFETQEAAERWAESVEFRAEQMKEEAMIPKPYTGPERRWMTRSLYDWTYRTEHHHTRFAREEARDIAILEKLRRGAYKRNRMAEAEAIFSGMYELQQKLAGRRQRIAEDCAPWFEGSAFQ